MIGTRLANCLNKLWQLYPCKYLPRSYSSGCGNCECVNPKCPCKTEYDKCEPCCCACCAPEPDPCANAPPDPCRCPPPSDMCSSISPSDPSCPSPPDPCACPPPSSCCRQPEPPCCPPAPDPRSCSPEPDPCCCLPPPDSCPPQPSCCSPPDPSCCPPLLNPCCCLPPSNSCTCPPQPDPCCTPPPPEPCCCLPPPDPCNCPPSSQNSYCCSPRPETCGLPKALCCEKDPPCPPKPPCCPKPVPCCPPKPPCCPKDPPCPPKPPCCPKPEPCCPPKPPCCPKDPPCPPKPPCCPKPEPCCPPKPPCCPKDPPCPPKPPCCPKPEPCCPLKPPCCPKDPPCPPKPPCCPKPEPCCPPKPPCCPKDPPCPPKPPCCPKPKPRCPPKPACCPTKPPCPKNPPCPPKPPCCPKPKPLCPPKPESPKKKSSCTCTPKPPCKAEAHKRPGSPVSHRRKSHTDCSEQPIGSRNSDPCCLEACKGDCSSPKSSTTCSKNDQTIPCKADVDKAAKELCLKALQTCAEARKILDFYRSQTDVKSTISCELEPSGDSFLKKQQEKIKSPDSKNDKNKNKLIATVEDIGSEPKMYRAVSVDKAIDRTKLQDTRRSKSSCQFCKNVGSVISCTCAYCNTVGGINRYKKRLDSEYTDIGRKCRAAVEKRTSNQLQKKTNTCSKSEDTQNLHAYNSVVHENDTNSTSITCVDTSSVIGEDSRSRKAKEKFLARFANNNKARSETKTSVTLPQNTQEGHRSTNSPSLPQYSNNKTKTFRQSSSSIRRPGSPHVSNKLLKNDCGEYAPGSTRPPPKTVWQGPLLAETPNTHLPSSSRATNVSLDNKSYCGATCESNPSFVKGPRCRSVSRVGIQNKSISSPCKSPTPSSTLHPEKTTSICNQPQSDVNALETKTSPLRRFRCKSVSSAGMSGKLQQPNVKSPSSVLAPLKKRGQLCPASTAQTPQSSTVYLQSQSVASTQTLSRAKHSSSKPRPACSKNSTEKVCSLDQGRCKTDAICAQSATASGTGTCDKSQCSKQALSKRKSRIPCTRSALRKTDEQTYAIGELTLGETTSSLHTKTRSIGKSNQSDKSRTSTPTCPCDGSCPLGKELGCNCTCIKVQKLIARLAAAECQPLITKSGPSVEKLSLQKSKTDDSSSCTSIQSQGERMKHSGTEFHMRRNGKRSRSEHKLATIKSQASHVKIDCDSTCRLPRKSRSGTSIKSQKQISSSKTRINSAENVKRPGSEHKLDCVKSQASCNRTASGKSTICRLKREDSCSGTSIKSKIQTSSSEIHTCDSNGLKEAVIGFKSHVRDPSRKGDIDHTVGKEQSRSCTCIKSQRDVRTSESNMRSAKYVRRSGSEQKFIKSDADYRPKKHGQICKCTSCMKLTAYKPKTVGSTCSYCKKANDDTCTCHGLHSKEPTAKQELPLEESQPFCICTKSIHQTCGPICPFCNEACETSTCCNSQSDNRRRSSAAESQLPCPCTKQGTDKFQASEISCPFCKNTHNPCTCQSCSKPTADKSTSADATCPSCKNTHGQCTCKTCSKLTHDKSTESGAICSSCKNTHGQCTCQACSKSTSESKGFGAICSSCRNTHGQCTCKACLKLISAKSTGSGTICSSCKNTHEQCTCQACSKSKAESKGSGAICSSCKNSHEQCVCKAYSKPTADKSTGAGTICPSCKNTHGQCTCKTFSKPTVEKSTDVNATCPSCRNTPEQCTCNARSKSTADKSTGSGATCPSCKNSHEQCVCKAYSKPTADKSTGAGTTCPSCKNTHGQCTCKTFSKPTVEKSTGVSATCPSCRNTPEQCTCNARSKPNADKSTGSEATCPCKNIPEQCTCNTSQDLHTKTSTSEYRLARSKSKTFKLPTPFCKKKRPGSEDRLAAIKAQGSCDSIAADQSKKCDTSCPLGKDNSRPCTCIKSQKEIPAGRSHTSATKSVKISKSDHRLAIIKSQRSCDSIGGDKSKKCDASCPMGKDSSHSCTCLKLQKEIPTSETHTCAAEYAEISGSQNRLALIKSQVSCDKIVGRKSIKCDIICPLGKETGSLCTCIKAQKEVAGNKQYNVKEIGSGHNLTTVKSQTSQVEEKVGITCTACKKDSKMCTCEHSKSGPNCQLCKKSSGTCTCRKSERPYAKQSESQYKLPTVKAKESNEKPLRGKSKDRSSSQNGLVTPTCPVCKEQEDACMCLQKKPARQVRSSCKIKANDPSRKTYSTCTRENIPSAPCEQRTSSRTHSTLAIAFETGREFRKAQCCCCCRLNTLSETDSAAPCLKCQRASKACIEFLCKKYKRMENKTKLGLRASFPCSKVSSPWYRSPESAIFCKHQSNYTVPTMLSQRVSPNMSSTCRFLSKPSQPCTGSGSESSKKETPKPERPCRIPGPCPPPTHCQEDPSKNTIQSCGRRKPECDVVCKLQNTIFRNQTTCERQALERYFGDCYQNKEYHMYHQETFYELERYMKQYRGRQPSNKDLSKGKCSGYKKR